MTEPAEIWVEFYDAYEGRAGGARDVWTSAEPNTVKYLRATPELEALIEAASNPNLELPATTNLGNIGRAVLRREALTFARGIPDGR